ncbi:hypothetical protein HZA86_03600 [Candidatus Uhrbacteria bacterium]|nr:hypothetical protein [Candidatus Uhrbacteria bacterium]
MMRIERSDLAKRFLWTVALSLLLGGWLGYVCGRFAGWEEILRALDDTRQFIDVDRIPQRKRYTLICRSGQYGVLADPVAPLWKRLFVKKLDPSYKNGDAIQRPH